MGIQVAWDNEEHTILRWMVDGPLVWEDYKAATDESYQMYDTVDHQVCVIFDIQKMKEVPGNTLARLPRISADTHPRVDYMVVVGAGSFTQRIGKIFAAVYGQMDFASSLEEAHIMIAERQTA